MLRKSTICAKSAAVVLVAVAVLALGQVLQAGTISIVDLPAVGTDAASGISTSNTYTATADLVQDGLGGTTTINLVPFTRYGTQAGYVSSYSGTGWVFSAVGGSGLIGTVGNTGNIGADGQMFTFLADFVYSQSGSSQLSLSGLTADVPYSLRIYYRPWESPASYPDWNSTMTFNGDGADAVAVVNMAVAGAHYVKYDYIASGTTATVSIVQLDGPGGWHMYGFSNQVIPEPGTLALLATGLVGLLCYAWRKRR